MTHSIISKRRRRRLRGKPDDFGRRLLAQKGSIPEDVDLGYGEDALAVLAPLIERANSGAHSQLPSRRRNKWR